MSWPFSRVADFYCRINAIRKESLHLISRKIAINTKTAITCRKFCIFLLFWYNDCRFFCFLKAAFLQFHDRTFLQLETAIRETAFWIAEKLQQAQKLHAPAEILHYFLRLDMKTAVSSWRQLHPAIRLQNFPAIRSCNSCKYSFFITFLSVGDNPNLRIRERTRRKRPFNIGTRGNPENSIRGRKNVILEK